MANAGNLTIDVNSLKNLYDTVCSKTMEAELSLYSQCESLYTISNSSYIGGLYADALKAYLDRGMINLNGGIIDVLASLRLDMQICYDTFLNIECEDHGVISEGKISSLSDFFNGIKDGYSNLEGEIFGHLCEASKYMSLYDVPLDDVKQSFDWMGLTFYDINSSIEENDAILLKGADAMYNRIMSLKNQIISVRDNCYTDGKLNRNCESWLNNKECNPQLANAELGILLQCDPFAYDPNGVTIKESEWMVGLSSQIYAYGGYSLLSGTYDAKCNSNGAYAKAKGHILEANQYAQLTDYAFIAAHADVIYGGADARIGMIDDYFGGRIDLEVGVVNVDVTAMLGTDDLNLYFDGFAKVLCADVSAFFEYDDGKVSYGAGAHATLAAVGANVGLGGANKADNSSAVKDVDDLFFVEVSSSVGVQSGIGGKITDEIVTDEELIPFELEGYEWHAFTVDADLELVPGVGITFGIPFPVKVPGIHPKKPEVNINKIWT